MTGEQEPRPDPYRELFERSADPILIIELDRFVDCNDAAARMLQCESREEVLKLHPSEISPPRQPDGRDSFEKANEYLEIAFTRGSHRFEWTHVRGDGETFPVEVLLTAIQEPDRQVLHVVWRDLAERKLLEDSLRHSQKMDAVGKLAGGIAHDFNNLLVAILGNADLLAETADLDAAAGRRLNEIRAAAGRAAALVKQLLAFGRKQQLLPGVHRVQDLVEEVKPLLERLTGADLPVTVEAGQTPLHIEADRGQIEQILLNLVSNARDATPGRGQIRIRVEQADVAPGTPPEEELEPGAYAVISVADTGAGMPAEVVAKACEPFFTTKGDQGSGLGLATAYGIARQSGGTLRIESTEGVGTTVRVFVPLTHKQPGSAEERSEVAAFGSGDDRRRSGADAGAAGNRILLVEDEEMVRNLVLSVLVGKGFEVYAAEDGVQGREIYRQESGRFDLVISDVILPHSTGPEMVAALEADGFRPRVLFVSGYTDDCLTPRHRVREGVTLLQKPFTPDELIARVLQLLDTT